MLEFNVNKQTLTRTDNFNPASDSINYLDAHFTFDDVWNDREIKALFETDGVTYPATLNSEGICKVPNGALKSNSRRSILNVIVSVIGTDALGTQITTNKKIVRVNLGGYDPSCTVDNTEDAYNNLLADISSMVTLIEEADVL